MCFCKTRCNICFIFQQRKRWHFSLVMTHTKTWVVSTHQAMMWPPLLQFWRTLDLKWLLFIIWLSLRWEMLSISFVSYYHKGDMVSFLKRRTFSLSSPCNFYVVTSSKVNNFLSSVWEEPCLYPAMCSVKLVVFQELVLTYNSCHMKFVFVWFEDKNMLENNNKYICFQSNTTMSIIQISGNKFRSFWPSSGHHYIKFKRLVTCSVH